MRKLLPLSAFFLLLITCIFSSCKNSNSVVIHPLSVIEKEDGDRGDMYDQPDEAYLFEILRTRDPKLGYVPTEKLISAIDYTENLKKSYSSANARFALLWNERGPVFDSVGPTNGNTRGGGGYTSGRMRAILIDTLNDPTGNTVIIGGVAGGIWKCTNFLSATPNWVHASDFFNNLAVSYICQDPSNQATMYFSTGEPYVNADAVTGAGIWKSTDAGNTWARLAGTETTFGRVFKMQCDAAGNLYVANRGVTANIGPFTSASGLYRSNDKGVTFINITPTGLTSSNLICSDIEITSTGKLHASFGYNTSATNLINYRYTTNPATVTSTTGWLSGVGLRPSNLPACRLELAAIGDILYAVTVNTAFNVDSCYKSIDGGATWTKQNTVAYTTGLGNTQGWYAVTLAINPANSNEFMVGGLDAYRSINSGQTISIVTNWVSALPYVHADHHFMQWFRVNGESRIVIGCDGGVYMTRDGGTTWQDRNKGLAIKQFYSADINPAAGSPNLIAGAQDNGTHSITTPGLTYSKEVAGGDGMFCHINQLNSLVQIGTVTGNGYRRSFDGGLSFINTNFSGGLFVNPWDFDDSKGVLYGGFAAGSIIRWNNAGTPPPAAAAAVSISIPGLGTGATAAFATAFKTNTTTADRLFIGGSFVNGSSGASATTKLLRVDNASTTFNVTNITSPLFSATAYLSCVNVGSTDNNLVVVFSNYGVNNIWVSNDGGTSWTTIDGNLPDMPVRWAMFAPGNDNRLMIATETGVWTTDAINGSSTIWDISPGFPTVRTDMLKLRTSDNTVVAATHGRGLFTAQFPGTVSPLINFASAATTVTEDSTGSIDCRRYKDYTVNVGILNPPVGDASVTFSVQAGTATQGTDFDFTTNGSFTSPSNQIIFKSGDATVVPITVRIYDDAEVEPAETFIIGFAITGTTNALKGTTSTHTFTILDNDRAPSVLGTSNITVGIYNANLSSLNTPFDGTKLKHRLQVIYTAGELQAAGFVTGGPISSLTVRVVTKNTAKPFKGFTVSIGHTGYTGLNTGYAPEVLTPVFSNDYSTVTGNNIFNFTTPFIWNGISNIVVQFCYDNTGTTAEGVTDVVEGNLAPLGVYRASTYSNYTTSTLPGCSLGAAFIDNARVNATFAATLGNNVATTLNTSRTEYLNSNNDLYYYSDKGEIITRVKNTSAQNYGCTQVIIDRAGTGSSQFWNFTSANYLMNKTFQILPTTNNITGTSEVTFYYTKEEKEGWEAATGQSWNNIMLIKIPSKISNVNPLNAQPDGPGTVTIVTPVRGTFGTGYTLTGTFANGFSGFGAGIPGRINTILTLSGQVDVNGKDINLGWTTSAEMVSTQFELEKSYDGINFFKIGTITAAGTKFSPSNYSFVDHEFVQINYYRVRLLHSDGVVILSNTIFVKNDNVPQRLIVLTNPFSNNIIIKLSRVSTSPLEFSVYDMQGRLIKKYIAPPGSLIVSINANGIISKGVYQLRVYIDDFVFYKTLLKQ